MPAHLMSIKKKISGNNNKNPFANIFKYVDEKDTLF